MHVAFRAGVGKQEEAEDRKTAGNYDRPQDHLLCPALQNDTTEIAADYEADRAPEPNLAIFRFTLPDMGHRNAVT